MSLAILIVVGETQTSTIIQFGA